MTRREKAALAAAAVLAVVVPTTVDVVTDDASEPAVSSHGLSSPVVVEAQAPVVGLRLRVGEYPGVNNKPLACDGSDVVSFDRIRIEPVVRLTKRPSEHWNLNFEVQPPKLNQPSKSEYDWDIQPLFHQNAPPVATRSQALSMELGQFGQGRLLERPGRWRIVVSINGLVSKQTYKAVCEFTVRPAPTP